MATKIETTEYVACDECQGRGSVVMTGGFGYGRQFGDWAAESTCDRCKGTGQLRVLTEAEEQAIWAEIHEELMASVRATKERRAAEAAQVAQELDRIEQALDVVSAGIAA